MTLLEMAQSHPEISVTVRLADLKAAALEMAQQIRRDAEADHRRRERDYGSPLVLQDKVAADLDVSGTTLWRWGKQGVLHPVKIGGKVYYRQAEIEAIVEAHTQKN